MPDAHPEDKLEKFAKMILNVIKLRRTGNLNTDVKLWCWMLLLSHIHAKTQPYAEKAQQLHVAQEIHALLVAPDIQELYAMILRNATLHSEIR